MTYFQPRECGEGRMPSPTKLWTPRVDGGTVDIIVVDYPPPEEATNAISTIRQIFSPRISFNESSLAQSRDCRGGEITILFLPPTPRGWDPTVEFVRRSNSHTHLIACLESKNKEHFRSALQLNLDDLIVLPIVEADIVEKIQRAERLLRRLDFQKVMNDFLDCRGLEQFIGASDSFVKALESIRAVSRADSPVLILGESGTGKEGCARAIHHLGRRAANRFVTVNCGALPESLFENELFGHERGAFTDASKVQGGLLEEADGGTMLLDEIDSMTLGIQSKLLRFLEEMKYKRLGSPKDLAADVRIIASSNCDLGRAAASSQFRQDLYYRINVLSITLPPLREREGDVQLLADFFLDNFSRLHQRGKMYLCDGALDAIRNYPWPGNIRELKNVMERAVVIAASNIVRASDLAITSGASQRPRTSQSLKEERRYVLEKFERGYLLATLHDTGGNVSQAARVAAIDRRSFQRLLRKYRLTAPRHN